MSAEHRAATARRTRGRTIFQGRLRHRARSLAQLLGVTVQVLGRRLLGRRLVAGWSPAFEIGNLFWRRQFEHALSLPSIDEGRAYFDSLYTVLDDPVGVEIRATQAGEPKGHWFVPRRRRGTATLLYFHGGGYTFYAAVTRHFIAVLADTLGLPIFAPDYRLTPEHPHPAQLEDGLAAYEHLLKGGVDPAQLVVCGDSAGGHLALMLIAHLHTRGLGQPALAIGLSPWTDTGRRGESQFGNDRYDLVQGWMSLQFGQWLKGGQDWTDRDVSPIAQEFAATAPIYLQAGGKEILVDMIRDFASELERQHACVRLDVWQDMTHEFHAWGAHLQQSAEAIGLLERTIAWATQDTARCPDAGPTTEVDSLVSTRQSPGKS